GLGASQVGPSATLCFLAGIDYKTTTILLDGRRVKLELWDTSGQGRFCTIFRSYSRGAQGILLVYDITNRWSFDGIDRWIKEIDEHAPGVPRILVGNRLHLAFKRQVPTEQARAYAEKNCMTFFEVSPLCNFNVIESFTELSRIVLMRHGMEKIWRPNRVFSLQDLCCRAIVSCTPVHLIDKLPLPVTIKSHLKSFSMANGMNAVMMHGRSYSLATGAGGGGSKGNSLKRSNISTHGRWDHLLPAAPGAGTWDTEPSLVSWAGPTRFPLLLEQVVDQKNCPPRLTTTENPGLGASTLSGRATHLKGYVGLSSGVRQTPW
ncbi:hypothetical protein EI555_019987, partial [Monodon monoceros]